MEEREERPRRNFCGYFRGQKLRHGARENGRSRTCRFERGAVTFRSDVTPHAVSRRFPPQWIYCTRIIREREREVKVDERALGK